MISERRLGKLVEKCYAGIAKESEIIEMLNGVLDYSDLGKALKKKRADLKVGELKIEGTRVTRGTYYIGKSLICINKILLEDIYSRKEGAIPRILNTFAHENKHYFQDWLGILVQYEIDQGTDEYRQSNIDIMGRSICYDSEKIEDLKYYVYLNNSMEKQARESGAEFTQFALNLFLRNKFIKNQTKDLIMQDVQAMLDEKVHRDYQESSLRGLYDLFNEKYKKEFLDYEFSEMDPEEVKRAGVLWMNLIDQNEFPEMYTKLLISSVYDPSLVHTRTKAKEFILSDKCSQDVRDRLEERLVRGYMRQTLKPDFYLEDTIELLSAESCYKIYKNILENEPEKLKTPFCKQILKDQKTSKEALELFKEHLSSFEPKNKYSSLAPYYYDGVRESVRKEKEIPVEFMVEVFMCDLINGYTGNESQNDLFTYIESEECPNNIKQKVIDGVVEVLKTGHAPESYYGLNADPIFTMISEEQFLDVYESILYNAPDLLCSHFIFEGFTNSKTALKAADIFFSSFESIYDKFSDNILEKLQEHCNIIGFFCHDKLTTKQQAILNRITGTQTQQTISK